MNLVSKFCRSRRGALPVGVVLGLLVTVLAGQVGTARAESLEELLTQVGSEYASAYSSPFLYSYGPNVNSNLYSTAHIPWTGLVFGIGVKAMTSKVDDADKAFSKVIPNVDLSDYDPSLPPGTMGDLYMSGPTIFGDTETDGSVQGFVNGLQVFNAETIPGLVESSWSPLLAPEAYIGGVAGLKFTVRYLPEIDTGDFGKTKYFGYGLQWNANGVLKTLPVDVMVGFFNQEFKVGSIYDATATSVFVGASKDFSRLTLYGGLAWEDSEMDVAYRFEHPTDSSLDSDVAFTVEGEQDTRFTLGVTLDFLAKLNLEAGLGNKMTTYSAGLMFGL